MKKLIVVGIIVLFIGASIIPSTIGTIEKKTVFKDIKSRGYIQDLIDNASDGDTINIPSGTYYENVEIDKSINLVGEDKNTTIIDGGGNGDVVYISANWVNISGFTIQYSGEEYNAGFNHNGTYYCSIKDNIIVNNFYGIIYGGVYNTIQKNMIKDNNIGIVFGHAYNDLNKVYDNNICTNNLGIFVESCNYNEIFSNNIMSNIDLGIGIFSCICGGRDNRVYHNNIIYNGQQAHNGEFFNYWDDGYPSGGNFWSDYTGIDNYSGPNQNIPGSDGIGDTPYPIPSIFHYQEDSYPLMEAWNINIPPIAEFSWTPILPEPGELILFNASESYDYDGFITLYEWDWDNDGEYDENHTNSTATHSWSSYGHYPVTLRVNSNNSEKDTERIFVRVGNGPPYEPYDPVPEDGATEVDVNANLFWEGSDPDGDNLTYDVYFGTSISPPKVADNMTETFYYIPYTFKFGTTYYWKIVAWDDLGASTAGPVWSFTTTSIDLEVSIIKPEEKKFYFRNKSLFSLPKNTLVFGYIDIIAIAIPEEGIEKIEFYINNVLEVEDFTAPYIYRWEAKSKLPFRYKIKVVAYHTLGYNAIEEMTVWKFF